jgi:hypothetical protein
MKWFTRWTDAPNERQEFQFGELLSFNPEYDCLHLTLALPRTRQSRTRDAARDPEASDPRRRPHT